MAEAVKSTCVLPAADLQPNDTVFEPSMRRTVISTSLLNFSLDFSLWIRSGSPT